MSKEKQLLRYKEEMKDLQSSLDQEKGSLTTITNSLCEELKVSKTTNNKTLEKKANSKINNLNSEYEELSEELEGLMEEIEEELETEEE